MTTLREAAQQALEALQWHYRQGHSNTLGGFRLKIDEKALRELSAALAQQDEPVQEQDVEDAIEAAYWHFDARKKGLNEWAYAPQSERDAFKAEARKLVRGYFPTRQAQDTKREMLAVADAFIRGKRAALAQQEEPVATLIAQRDALLEALKRIESAVDWYLGRSSFTQTTQLKGLGHSASVRKELFAAHDETRAAIKAVEGEKK